MSNPLSDALAYLTRWRNPYAIAVEQSEEYWTEDEIAAGGYRIVANLFLARYTNGFDRSAEYLFLRKDWSEPARFILAEQHPAMDISGLYWKPI